MMTTSIDTKIKLIHHYEMSRRDFIIYLEKNAIKQGRQAETPDWAHA